MVPRMLAMLGLLMTAALAAFSCWWMGLHETDD